MGDRLQELRKDHHLTQQDLAEKLSVSPFTVSSYECNRSDPDDETKVKIALLFRISVDYLLGLTDEPYPFDRRENCLLLPPSFGEEEREQVRLFVRFLRYQQMTSKKEKPEHTSE